MKSPNVKDNPEKSISLDFVCKCGFRRRVDVEYPRLGTRQVEPYVLRPHCSKDKEHLIPERVIQVWEER